MLESRREGLFPDFFTALEELRAAAGRLSDFPPESGRFPLAFIAIPDMSYSHRWGKAQK
jgi:hypothetical protein